jgi:hypothetical protein
MGKRQGKEPPAPLMQVVEVRVVLSKDVPPSTFLQDLLNWGSMGDVFGVAELQADGFGHLLPRGYAEVALDEPQASEVQRALETGEVA